MSKQTASWTIVVLILLALFLFSSFLANLVDIFKTEEEVITGNIALIPVKGIITSEKYKDILGSQEGVSSTTIIEMIKKAEKNENIKAVIFEINSPGGSAVASEEISSAIKDLNKTTVAWIREVGASGAYWAASATNHIIASRMSATGSIGVISSYLEFAGLLEDYNVTYRRLISGKYKDAGSPFKELTPEEEKKKLSQLRKVHDYFIESVAKNRGMDFEKIKISAEGEVFLGGEALALGLIDEIGSKKEAIQFIEEKLNITADVVAFEEKKTLADILASLISRHGYSVGIGANEHESLVVKT